MIGDYSICAWMDWWCYCNDTVWEMVNRKEQK